jgi:hypothetical protein
MAISEPFQSSGSSWGSEYFLAAGSTTQGSGQSDDGVYQLFLDLSAVAAGDIYQIKCYDAISSGGTSRVIFIDNVTGPLDSPHYVTPSLILLHKWDFSVVCISGTNSRSIVWSIRKVA